MPDVDVRIVEVRLILTVVRVRNVVRVGSLVFVSDAVQEEPVCDHHLFLALNDLPCESAEAVNTFVPVPRLRLVFVPEVRQLPAEHEPEKVPVTPEGRVPVTEPINDRREPPDPVAIGDVIGD